MTEKSYAIVDELDVIAKAHDSTVARIALPWVQAQPGVSSIIIGARRLAQLEDNLKALGIKRTSVNGVFAAPSPFGVQPADKIH